MPKRLGSTSEYKTRAILQNVLAGTGFHVYPELMLNKVLNIDKRRLNKKERETLNNASFDFVVYNSDSYPEFAVEFDGPHHTTTEERRQSDIRKNRLCAMDDLQLLRINDEFLTEYEKTSVLEYIVPRFVDWRNDWQQIRQEEADIVNHLSSRSATEAEYDAVQDPAIMWDLEHPFPASLTLAELLYSKFGIVSSHVDADIYCQVVTGPKYRIFQRNRMGDESVGLYHRRLQREYELLDVARDADRNYKSEKIHSVWVRWDYCFSLPHVDIDRSDSAKPLFMFEVSHGQNLPGISMFEVADHFCDFLALEKLRTWADENMPRN
jgi:very-short-patch-repair endonuclease